MVSAFRIVERRCAITIVVRSFDATSPSIACWTSCSFSESRAIMGGGGLGSDYTFIFLVLKYSVDYMLDLPEVASSRRSILGFFNNARAIATLCFWPPDRRTPLYRNKMKILLTLFLQSVIGHE